MLPRALHAFAFAIMPATVLGLVHSSSSIAFLIASTASSSAARPAVSPIFFVYRRIFLRNAACVGSSASKMFAGSFSLSHAKYCFSNGCHAAS